MLATLVVGGIFAGIFFIALKKTRQDIKDNKCGSCGGGCSAAKKKTCGITTIDMK